MRPAASTYISKEANRLEDVQAGLIANLGDVVHPYIARADHTLRDLVLPALAGLSSRQLAAQLSVDRRTIDRIRQGQQPRPALFRALTHAAVDIALHGLELGKRPTGATDQAILTAWLDRRQVSGPTS